MTGIFRTGLLDDRPLVLAHPARDELRDRLATLGAVVSGLTADPADEDGTRAAAEALGPVETLVVDAAASFMQADGAEDELAPLRVALDGAWAACRAVANAAWIGPGRPGKIVLVAPGPDAGPHAAAARAALENLARTLSIEWARHRIRTTAITPGADTTAGEVADLAAYLASPAGDYFSGARLDLTR